MSIRVYKRKHKNTITWTASVTVRGVTPQRKPHTRGGFPTREQAEQHARAKEQELLGRLEGIPKLKGVRFDSFAIEYLELCKKNNTQKHYATKKYVILKSIVPFFENKTLLNIQATDVEAYISKRQQEGVSQKTLLNEYTLLKHMLNQAVKWDYLRVNPCIKVARPKVVLPLPQVLTKDQIKQVLEFIDKNEEYYRCKYLVGMLFYTGCRRDEISNMRWSDVDLDQNIITV